MSESTQTAATEPTVAVSIVAADRGTQIVVIDASFGQLALGVGRLQLSLARGIYKARFKVGDRI